ncbi:MAG: 16S rRNA (uracil(1498)-N(3))-methyltransferase [Betaproteobacteria bacterium]|nr:16S rRNA (uracil(1498)-N(3))-methyltransferase [Betaproteobacteria bacterium]
MGSPRFHVTSPLGPADVGTEVALPAAAAHHVLRVLRLAVGAPVTLFTGAGGEFAATLARASKHGASVRLDAFAPVERESALAITLVQAIAATDTVDGIVRHATELGAAAIQPVVSQHGFRFPSAERGVRRLEHWRQIAIAACEQCGRNRVPAVHDVVTLDDWLRARPPARMGIVSDPAAAAGVGALAAPSDALDLLIGPEGGLSADEVARAVRAGMAPVRLGPRILRAETAALAALAALNSLWGDFR